MSGPKVTVVIPSFNRKDVITECLNSVLSQTFGSWECIVVDDGSVDGTQNIVQRFVESDSRFRLLHRDAQAKGACTCRNIGLQNALGEYVIFLDSDDLLVSKALEVRVKSLDRMRDLDFVVSGTVVFDNEIGDVSRYLCFPHETIVSDVERFFMFDHPWLTTAPTWRRSFLLGSRLVWREGIDRWQDLFFHLDCLAAEPSYQRLAGFDNGWRRSGNGKITRLRKADRESFLLLVDALSQLESRPLQGALYRKYLPLVYTAFCKSFRGSGCFPWLKSMPSEKGGMLQEYALRDVRNSAALRVRSGKILALIDRLFPSLAEEKSVHDRAAAVRRVF